VHSWKNVVQQFTSRGVKFVCGSLIAAIKTSRDMREEERVTQFIDSLLDERIH
jgi:hypothetical protein